MPFDAMFLTAVAAELRPALVGARVDKIQQPARDTVVLQLRGRDGGGRLLLSANGNRPRVHLTQAQLENPAQPPMFCMLLRKHLAGGRLAGIRQPAAERMLDLTFDCTDELGVPCRKHLILELVGRNSNLILTGPDGRILDCLRRVDFEMSELRQLLPGLFYHEPPRTQAASRRRRRRPGFLPCSPGRTRPCGWTNGCWPTLRACRRSSRASCHSALRARRTRPSPRWTPHGWRHF